MVKNYLPFELSGNQNSLQILVFLHGWPDSCRLWDQILPQFEKEYICLNISYCVDDFFGINFQEIGIRLKNTIDSVDGGRNLKKVLVSHDWGCLFAFQLDNAIPNYISDHIAMDVSASLTNNKKLNIFHVAKLAAYQVTLAVAFLISFIPVIGNLISTIITIMLSMFKIFGDNKIPSFQQISPKKQNYPYFYLWFGGIPPPILDARLKNYKPASLLYLYGKDKPFQFQGLDWLDTLQNLENCEAIQVSGGHWIMRNHQEKVVEYIKRRTQSKVQKI